MSEFTEQTTTFHSGERTLFGILHIPQVPADTGVVILVGGPQYRVGSHRMFVQIARRFARRRYPVLRFDFAGMGDSEGTFAGFEHLDGDVAEAIGELCRVSPSLKHVVLFGLCDGATAAAYYAPTDPRVSAAVLLNPWVHTESAQAKTYLWHYYPRRILQADFWRGLFRGRVAVAASAADFLAKVWRTVARSKRGLRETTSSFVDRMRDALDGFRGRLLVLASERDFTASEFVDLWTSDDRWRRIRGSAGFVELKDADHTLSSGEAIESACDAVCDWLEKGSLGIGTEPVRG